MHIDFNCDMGESFGPYSFGADEELMRFISSANVAGGFHAGDPHVMRKTVALAKEHGVAVGVHSGYRDLVGFGRREIRPRRRRYRTSSSTSSAPCASSPASTGWTSSTSSPTAPSTWSPPATRRSRARSLKLYDR